MEDWQLDTALLHGENREEAFLGSTTVPIFQTSAYYHRTAEELEQIFNHQIPGFGYSRTGNPTVEQFEKRMAQIEGGVSATACASGSAAVAMTLLTILQSGDEVIMPSGLYGGTLDMMWDLEAFGVKARYVEDFTPQGVEPLIHEHTKAIFIEIIANPKLTVIDVKAIAETAHKHGIVLIADATTVTPVLMRPIEQGADIVIHSSSKYINSNGSAISGIIVDSGRFDWNTAKYRVFGKYQAYGKDAFTTRLRGTFWRDIGPCLAPMHAFLNLSGMETLPLRMDKICRNAQALAEYFQQHSRIHSVNYPGLKTHPQHSLVERQFACGYGGGILTIRVGSKKKAFAVIDHLQCALNVTNIGDTKTLVVHPASTIFVNSNEEERRAAGVFEDQIRISVGLENVQDLMRDFDEALKAADAVTD